jgi:hypothetical protein
MTRPSDRASPVTSLRGFCDALFADQLEGAIGEALEELVEELNFVRALRTLNLEVGPPKQPSNVIPFGRPRRCIFFRSKGH